MRRRRAVVAAQAPALPASTASNTSGAASPSAPAALGAAAGADVAHVASAVAASVGVLVVGGALLNWGLSAANGTPTLRVTVASPTSNVATVTWEHPPRGATTVELWAEYADTNPNELPVPTTVYMDVTSPTGSHVFTTVDGLDSFFADTAYVFHATFYDASYTELGTVTTRFTFGACPSLEATSAVQEGTTTWYTALQYSHIPEGVTQARLRVRDLVDDTEYDPQTLPFPPDPPGAYRVFEKFPHGPYFSADRAYSFAIEWLDADGATVARTDASQAYSFENGGV